LLAQVESTARGTDNLLPVIVAAVEACCTLGEISDALRNAWGEARQFSNLS
jgi:methylmalonyl-CoA mutase N-terminal domain/subunit